MSALPQNKQASGWCGEIDIHFKKRPDKTVMQSVKHIGPLRVQRPFYPEGDICHVYLLHPPGGVVGGDSLTIKLNVDSNSHALLTTPGSTKFYRSVGELAHVQQSFVIKDKACLEWFPQENIFFPGSKIKSRTEIHLTPQASFFGWEINCLGRPVINEVFDTGEIDSGLLLYRDGQVVLNERQRVSQLKHLSSSAGLRSYPMNAVFIATGCNEELVDEARNIVEKLKPDFPVGITLLDDLLVLRALGRSAEKMQKIIIPVWQMLRPKVINKQSITPRIWLT